MRSICPFLSSFVGKREHPKEEVQPAQLTQIISVSTHEERQVVPREPDYPTSDLVTAVWQKNEWWTKGLLALGADPNKNNLLPRVIMCRVPFVMDVDDEDQLDEKQAEEIEKFATILVQNRARLDPIHVEEFVAFQSELEKKITRALISISDMDAGDRSVLFNIVQDISQTDTDLHNLLGFKAMRKTLARSTNPFLQIINNTIKSGDIITSNEREICRFAADLLPKLVEISEEKTDSP
ncbi:MAG TPA: hypothetical protein VLG76_08600 [Rhabdochlamydiaceae bacterium]|nr:hypothetical protein [Rhabdochlamydiaceae bacterium]